LRESVPRFVFRLFYQVEIRHSNSFNRNSASADGLDAREYMMRLWQLRVLFKRQIYATFQEDEAAMSLIPFFGDGHLLWTSDYPHPESAWPNSPGNRTAGEAPAARYATEAHAGQRGEVLGLA